MEIQSVGVVGAGQMGNGIAHVFALAGYDVLMTDISRDALDQAVALIDRNIERQVSRGKLSAEDKAAAMARISTTMQLSDLGKTDLIIEAATERETVKQAIFEDLLPHLKPTTILTSNIDMSEMKSCCKAQSCCSSFFCGPVGNGRPCGRKYRSEERLRWNQNRKY